MRYIKELREGDRISDIYMIKQKNSATTKNGKSYENLILQDKTGTLDAKIWEPNSAGIDDFDAKDYVEIIGESISNSFTRAPCGIPCSALTDAGISFPYTPR